MGSGVKDIFNPVVDYAKGSLGLNGFTGLRDSAETLGTLAGNYLLPGSSMITSNLASKGSQNELNSPLGRVGQIGTGLSGGGFGESVTGIPSASEVGAGWSGLGNTIGSVAGYPAAGTDAASSLSSLFGGGADAGKAAGSVSGSGAGAGSNWDSTYLAKAAQLGGTAPATAGTTLSGALSGGTGGGISSYLPAISAVGGTLNTLNATDQAKKDLLEAENKSQNVLNPYLASGASANSRLSDLLGTSGNAGTTGYGDLSKPFTAADLANDPGYQFRLNEGNKALDRQAAAKGNFFSGSALKGAEDYGQGLADSTYKDAFARDQATKAQTYGMYSGQSGAGQNAAGAAGNIYENTGNATANAGISSSNSINQLLSSLLSGSGSKRPVNIGGQVVYI